MDAALARADLLMNIFLNSVEDVGAEESYVERCINCLEADLFYAHDAN
jgi:hypothetical protein